VLPDPGGRAPAPWPLRGVQLFANTLDIENGVDELVTPADAVAALVRAGVVEGGVQASEADLRTALEVREALRAVLLANNGGPVLADAHATLEAAARAGHLGVRFDDEGRALLEAETTGVTGALAGLVAIAATAMADGSWARLKACRRDVCHWIFYDRSRNGASIWCAMSVCGNRTKTRTYRSRRRAA